MQVGVTAAMFKPFIIRLLSELLIYDVGTTNEPKTGKTNGSRNVPIKLWYRYTLKVEIFAGRNFRDFASFLGFCESLYPRNRTFIGVREI